uniref:Uncharacterized protein n=1 Tax=viral metagenome TaxID=1070528 RepID=A0A6M3LC90_9ZZZZ
MRKYPKQPDNLGVDMDKVKGIIEDIIEDDLPDSPVNQWFLDSVNFANMVDRIMARMWENV